MRFPKRVTHGGTQTRSMHSSKKRSTRRASSPLPPADRRTLIRRAYLDLIGLLPTPEEVEAFVNDPSPNAWEKRIDQLLASPHYGERWGRHWLDVARYADSWGHIHDDDNPNAWRYRDYVIKSSIDDKPYNRFILEQLAGDEVDEVTHETLDRHQLPPHRPARAVPREAEPALSLRLS